MIKLPHISKIIDETITKNPDGSFKVITTAEEKIPAKLIKDEVAKLQAKIDLFKAKYPSLFPTIKT